MVNPSTPRRVYIDTMILVCHVWSEFDERDNRITKATKKFLKEIMDKKYIGIVSTHTMNETIAILKKHYAELNTSNPSDEDIECLISKLEMAIKKLGFEYHDADILSRELPSDDWLFSQSKCIIIKSESIHTPTYRNPKRWSMLGGADAIHVVLAKQSKADFFATFDKGFKGLKDGLDVLLLDEVYLNGA